MSQLINLITSFGAFALGSFESNRPESTLRIGPGKRTSVSTSFAKHVDSIQVACGIMLHSSSSSSLGIMPPALSVSSGTHVSLTTKKNQELTISPRDDDEVVFSPDGVENEGMLQTVSVEVEVTRRCVVHEYGQSEADMLVREDYSLLVQSFVNDRIDVYVDVTDHLWG